MLVSDLFLAIKKLGSLKSQLTVSAASGVSETDRVSVPAIDSPATARPLSSGSIVAGSGRAGEASVGPRNERPEGMRAWSRDRSRFDAVFCGISSFEMQIGAVELSTRQVGDAFQHSQTFWEQHRIGFIDGCDRNWSQDIPVVINDRNNLLAALMFMTRVADAIAAFFGHRIGPIAMEDAQIEVVVLRQMPHARDKGGGNGTVIGPFGKDFRDGGRVDCSVSIAIFGHG